MPRWFRRFGDIPGVGFEAHPHVDRRKLQGYDSVPEVHVHVVEGKREEALSWPVEDGSRSTSPASSWALGDSKDLSSPVLLRTTYEKLELPGEPSDYHFILQGCAGDLWKRRREEPEMLEEVEKLCWLDIRLVETHPEAITFEGVDGPSFVSIHAFSLLIDLYEREGFLREALEVANRAVRFNQCQEDRERLLERITAVEAEDAG